MRLTLVMLALALACEGALAQVPTIKRSSATVHRFQASTPCPDGPDKGKLGQCEGYVVDHRWPLCARGLDVVENMRYQTIAEAKVKDAEEKRICAELRRWSQ